MLRQSKWLRVAGLGLCVAAGGCANFVDDEVDEESALEAGERLSAALKRAADCPDLLSKLQADALAKLDLEIALYKKDLARYDDELARGGLDAGAGVIGGGAIADGPASDEGPAAPSSGGNTGGAGTGTTNGGALGGFDGADRDQSAGESEGGGSAPVGGSDTNNQVREVDEADFVKMVEDRTRFYLLHGRDLYTFQSWPADALATSGSPLQIEGDPREMFVHDGTAVVFSWVDRGDLGFAYDDYRYQPFTKLTVLDLRDGDTPRVTRELYAEGSYTSSRRYDALVRVVLQSDSPAPARFYPDIQAFDDFGNPFPQEEIDTQLAAWRARTAASIEATELADWLPTQYERVGGELRTIEPSCPDHYTPTAGASEAGLTRVVELDLSDAGAGPSGLTVLGGSSLVYSNVEALVLAHNDYRWDARDFGLIDEQRVALHVFALDGDDTHYTASGWAPGHVLNQFALDEKDGVVRVSTSGWRRSNPDADEADPDFWNSAPHNQVVTLRPDEEAELNVIGHSGDIGKPDETTRSTRFVGDRAYVVTFLQTDPLIVIDLEDPEELEVLGELEIPGFSEYMHPLGDHHLLTIGQNGDEVGLTGGIALQIFDVEDPTDPQLAHRHAFSPNSSSSASYDHKAFTFYDAQGLLAFPMVDWGARFSSTLQVFQVSAEDGFEQLGAVDHTNLFEGCLYSEFDYYYYECGYQPDVRRGMFVEGEDATYVYTVSLGGVTAHAVDDLDMPLGSVNLPQPEYYYGGYYYPGEFWGDF